MIIKYQRVDYNTKDVVSEIETSCRVKAWSHAWSAGFKYAGHYFDRYFLDGKRISFNEWIAIPWPNPAL